MVVATMIVYLQIGSIAVQADPGDPKSRPLVVVAGIDMDRPAIESLLEECLLTDLEYVQGSDAWLQFADPLPCFESDSDEVCAEEETS